MLQNCTVFQSIVINYIKGAQCKSEMCIGSLCLYSYSNSRKQGFSISSLPCHEFIVSVSTLKHEYASYEKFVLVSRLIYYGKEQMFIVMVRILQIIKPC